MDGFHSDNAVAKHQDASVVASTLEDKTVVADSVTQKFGPFPDEL